ncbi:MAG: AMP-binding protein [Chloroflexi bacterium]|nr:AMP-binding protein [Chloroflexota bacterium]
MNTLVDLLTDAHSRFGGRTALAMRQGYHTQRWSYRRLKETSGQATARLQGQAVRTGDRIMIWAQNSPQVVAVFFGCLRAGPLLYLWTCVAHASLQQRW